MSEEETESKRGKNPNSLKNLAPPFQKGAKPGPGRPKGVRSARVFNGIEISSGYVDIRLKRWVNYTKNGVVYRNKKIINL